MSYVFPAYKNLCFTLLIKIPTNISFFCCFLSKKLRNLILQITIKATSENHHVRFQRLTILKEQPFLHLLHMEQVDPFTLI
jgi:hypothetical protein